MAIKCFIFKRKTTTLLMATVLRFLSGTFAINVALGRSGLFCDKVDKQIFDGETEISVELNNECETSRLKVDLSKRYSIQYVVIHHGQHFPESLDYFDIDMVEGQKSEACGEYPSTAKVGQAMRVNCKDVTYLFSVVQLRIKKGDLDIAEFEVHTLALKFDKFALLHRGCYAKLDGKIFEEDWQKCQRKCFFENFVFVGVKGNKLCSCNNNINPEDSLPDDKCDILCESSQRFCGGLDGFSVYIIKPPLPYYHSCIISNPERIESKGFDIPDISITKCLRQCPNVAYIGIQDNRRCLCFEYQESNYIRSSVKNCDMVCSGDNRVNCGSNDGLSLYRTCVRHNSMDCKSILQCKDDHYDMYGRCEDGCKPGYSGDHCMHKDLNIPASKTTEETEQKKPEKSDQNEFFELAKIILPLIILILLLLSCFLMLGGSEGTAST